MKQESHIKPAGPTGKCFSCGREMNFMHFQPLDRLQCPSCKAEVLVPGVLEGYTLVHFLGDGAVGRVYLAKDPTLERDVAIKILNQNLNATPKMWSILENEAKLAASISHHNVIQIFSLGKVKSRPFIVMELALEESLEARMRKQPISEREAVLVGLDVLKGLQAAANKNLMHGDVKPANIMMGPPGYTKLTDFGLARFLKEGQQVERWGTPYYIAPERSKQIQEDFRSDLYSLGTTLYHAVSGTPPFEGKTGEEVIQKSLNETPPKLRTLGLGISQDFSRIVEIMMHRNMKERFYSYSHAINCFELMRDGEFSYKSLRNRKPQGPGMIRNVFDRVIDLVQDPEPTEESAEENDPENLSPFV